MLRVVLRLLALLALLGGLALGGLWFAMRPAPPPRDAPPRATATERAPRAATFAAPAAGAAGLATPFGDAMFRWRCTTGLRDALGGHAAWPVRRIAGFCLCIADRMREDGLRDMPAFRGGDLTTGLAAAEAALCRRP
jgi:hypothetical protein